MVRRWLSPVLAVLLALGVFAQPVSATTERVVFEATSVFVTELSGSREVRDGVLYGREIVQVFAFTSSNPRVSGTSTVVINFDLDLATGSGEMWGKELLEPAAYPASGYRCSWSGTWASWAWAGRDVCHGFGALVGWQVRYLPSSSPTVTGYIFHPGK